DQPATTYTATTTVTAGQHEVKIEYYERGGAAVAQMSGTGDAAGPTSGVVTPSATNDGSAAFPLTADGTKVVVGATVHWNGGARPACPSITSPSAGPGASRSRRGRSPSPRAPTTACACSSTVSPSSIRGTTSRPRPTPRRAR